MLRPAGKLIGDQRTAQAGSATKKGRRIAAPLDRPRQIGRSGERGFAFTASYEKLVADLCGEHVFLLLEPGQFGLQVTHTPLQAAHFGYYAGIKPADVAK
jgi:hypothetical protein